MDILTHLDEKGNIKMVDVSKKSPTERMAVARGEIHMSERAMLAVESNEAGKGNPLEAARLAGIMAAKRTFELIPLCHQIPLTNVEIDFRTEGKTIKCECSAKTIYATGVEMEALTGVSVALLTIYDMLKAVDKKMVIGDIHLSFKSGGKSGTIKNDEESEPLDN